MVGSFWERSEIKQPWNVCRLDPSPPPDLEVVSHRVKLMVPHSSDWLLDLLTDWLTDSSHVCVPWEGKKRCSSHSRRWHIRNYITFEAWNFLLTALWEAVCPRSVLDARSPTLSEEDESGLTLEGHLLARIKELLRTQRAPVVRSTREATILAWKKEHFIGSFFFHFSTSIFCSLTRLWFIFIISLLPYQG